MTCRTRGTWRNEVPPHLPPSATVKLSTVALGTKSGASSALQKTKCHPTFPHQTAKPLPPVALGHVNHQLRHKEEKTVIYRHTHIETRIYAQHGKQVPPATHTPNSGQVSHA